ncbi:DUF1376 domain-containing protein [Sinorhizobium meliloti]|uniref:YdaU family protein n=1 Tax=Rhizobium meliloti TaxID=382 RepID=UPI000B49D3FB|nr:DUF1376 domain-containing protein [Sinorhizobium meliloti]ASP85023.1 DUF1376 domain-containing protein [Sinorhizobium meliloti]MQW28476.1 DUF1376 domain-containing protein [Sinorhizobium meliloti]
MSNRAWMPLHIADYLSDTGHLTAAEHGAYLLMIMHYWQNGGLPDNERLIARIARLTADQWEESREVLAMLFGPGWTHKRIDAELSKADEIIEKRRAAADARYNKSKSNANAEQVQSKCSDTGASPLTDNLSTSSLHSEADQKKRERENSVFQRWFETWPTFTSDDADKAHAAWLALSEDDRAAVVANTPGYIATVKASKRDTWHSAEKFLVKRLWTRAKARASPDTFAVGQPSRHQTREEYLAAELRRSERSFR